MNGVEGYMYPNEITLYWSVLIVLYPYITGLVAGAFILASLVRVFNVKAVAPTYRLALLTALAFLIVAPLPLQLHLGHPGRSPEMYFTPHSTSAMAMFGFVYLWYLMAVLVFEIWLDYRSDIVHLSQTTTGLLRRLYRIMTLGSQNIGPRSLAIDHKVGWIVTIVGIPSALILHGYVGFIFGSVKANPWWNSPLMPVVFIFSAMVSGIAAVLLLYMLTTWMRKQPIDMPCVDTIAMYLFYIFILDFSLEMLGLVHRIYEADESFRTLNFMRPHQALLLADRSPDLYRNAGSDLPASDRSGHKAARDCAQAHLRCVGVPGADRRLCHALERRHRRPVVLQELPRIHHLQDGPGHQGGAADGDLFDHSPVAASVGTDEAAASLAGERRAGRAGTRGLIAAPRVVILHRTKFEEASTKFSPPPQPHLIPRSAVRSASNDVRTLAAGLWLERNQSSCGLAKSMRCGFP